MATKKYVSLSKLSSFLDNLKNTFSSKVHTHEISDITNLQPTLDTYVLNVDYSVLEFDTSSIVSNSTSSAIMGVGQLGQIVLGSS